MTCQKRRITHQISLACLARVLPHVQTRIYMCAYMYFIRVYAYISYTYMHIYTQKYHSIQIYTRTRARTPKRALLPANTFFHIEAKQPCHMLKSPTAYQKSSVASHKSLHHTATHYCPPKQPCISRFNNSVTRKSAIYAEVNETYRDVVRR